MSKLIDLTGKDFGYWHVIKRGENTKDGRAQWLCHCTLCDKTTKLVQGAHLRGGKSTSCGCTKMAKMRNAIIKHEEGKIYGFLQVNRMATPEEIKTVRPINATGVYWNCTCLKCGKENVIVKGDYLRNGDTTSCGCLISKNESLITQMLENLSIKFIKQYTFPDLTSTDRSCDKLISDFAIFDQSYTQLLYLIEYDGIQHFSESHAYSTSDFNTTRKNDLLKNQYCFLHSIPLIRIPYDYKYTLNDLKLETTTCLLTPINEQNYYDR